MRIRVPIFDDEPAIRSLLWQLLDGRGYEVFSFPEAGSCPLYISHRCQCSEDQACTDIIISDNNMPIIDGLEFIENQMKKGCKVKNTALMSGDWSESNLQYAERLGCQIFHKPFGLDEINKWLDECEKRIKPDRNLSNWFIEDGFQSVKNDLL
jgi:CheY-like chemotaxis protein